MGSKREGVMLAYPADEKRLKKLPAKVFFQTKLNGERIRIDNNKLVTSCNNEVPFLFRIKEELMKEGLMKYPLDGELYCHGLSREEIHSMVSRRKVWNTAEHTLEFHVFDLAVEGMQQAERIIRLKNILPENNPAIKMVETLFDFKDNMLVHADRYISGGYEGVIIRDPEGFYIPRKTNNMLKFKPSSEDVYKIVGFEQEETIHGELKDSLGSLIVIDDDGRTFNVGTGKALTKESRERLWKEKGRLIGLWARVKHSDIVTVNGYPTCTSLLGIEIH